MRAVHADRHPNKAVRQSDKGLAGSIYICSKKANGNTTRKCRRQRARIRWVGLQMSVFEATGSSLGQVQGEEKGNFTLQQ